MKKGGLERSYVIPGYRKAKVGEEVTWELNDTSAIFFFPDKKLFGKHIYRVKKGKKMCQTVKDVPAGDYPYAVFTDNNDFAEGGSFPKIIIR